ncbi:MAG: Asp-tRNA(Asn)/Glu-tRNA(Gln) amidotransferase subunit GatA [Thermodesulfobacteriota bacterium]
MNPFELTIGQAAQELASGNLSSVELTTSCIQRIEAVDPKIKSFLTVSRDRSLARAGEADKKLAAGDAPPLCGIPLSLKDLICTKGVRTSCGSKILDPYIPPYNATVVDKLEENGAVVLGKVAMDEFGMGSTTENCAYQVPENPWKPGYICGGSSGGSASSVASRECLGSFGSDTGGSIRQPASLCGVVGMKPTYGRVSRYGLVAFASSLDQIGPLSRDVSDCALMMNAISGYDEKDSTSVKEKCPDFSHSLKEGMSGLRVGVPKEYFSQGLSPEVEGVVRNGIDALAEAGAEIVDVSLPRTEYCVAAYYIIAPAEASSNLARYDGVAYGYRDESAETLLEMYKQSRSQGFGDEVKRRILIGTYALSSGYYDAYYKKASQVRTLILEDFRSCFDQCDLVVSPVCPTPAWKIGEKSDDPLSLYLSDILTISANLAGIPAMSVPGGFSKDGLPIGIQLQGPHFKEETLFQAAFNLEKSLAVPTMPPEI